MQCQIKTFYIQVTKSSSSHRNDDSCLLGAKEEKTHKEGEGRDCWWVNKMSHFDTENNSLVYKRQSYVSYLKFLVAMTTTFA